MARKFAPQIATANDLLEGDVIYLTAAGDWSREIGDAAIAVNPEAAAELLARAQSCPGQAVGAYLVDTLVDGQGRAAPGHFREVFRTSGPSNYPEHGRQAER